MIQPGRLKTPLELQALTDVEDGMGGSTTAWTTAGTVWAEMWAVKGEERAASSTTEARVSHRVRMWAFPGLTTTGHRFKLGTRTFNISFINDVEARGVEYVADCLEIVGKEAS